MAPRLPDFREPQLCTLVKEAPEGDEWLHELKFDGYRILARVAGGAARLDSRRGRDYSESFAAVRRAVERLPCQSALLDGEVAALEADGRTSFQALHGAADNLTYFVFDLLSLDGEDVAARPLEERKARLAELLAGAPPILRYSDHVVGNGAAFFATACARRLEGIISKRRDQPYRSGRGASWVKTKCVARQELVIGGYTDSEGPHGGLGALLCGYYEDGQLVYAGKVGTGFQKIAADLFRELTKLRQADSPFERAPPTGPLARQAHWVEPTLVGEVEFAEWTADGRLRHPSFKGLRTDKPARQVVREREVAMAAAAPSASARARPAARKTTTKTARTTTKTASTTARKAARPKRR